ncbi:MAG: hypothetical protein D3916_05820 [Candidatus Electrothrix sp. MAN1_4]|nr:hypothetical protein [Candidatus Electrothrix sp. MAN1_4]
MGSLIVILSIKASLQDHDGLRGVLKFQVGLLSSEHFVWFKRRGGVLFLEHGYEFMGRRVGCFEIAASRILTVEWSPGQATALSGTDQDDWTVCLWYSDRNSKRYGKSLDEFTFEAVQILTQPQPRDAAERVGWDEHREPQRKKGYANNPYP